MKKKSVALLLVAAMCAGSLAGCGGSDSADKGTSGAATPAAEQTVDADGKVDGLMYAEGLPIVDEGAYNFSIFVDDSSATGEFVMMPILKEQTGVDVELRLFPYETAKERLNLDLNSGDYADVIGGWTLSDSMILTYGVNQGVFIPLEDYFEKYCPNITAMLDRPGVREKMTAPDGHIYTIPYVVDDTTVGYTPFINTDWLKNVNMEMPTTTEEFEAVLQAFKDQDANGNGDASDEIPFSADPNNKHIEAMTGWFGLPMNKTGIGMLNEEVTYGGISSTYREFLTWFNGLYEKGLVDVELFTQDTSTWEGKGNQDMYGVSIAYGSNEFSGIPQSPEKPPYDVLPVLNVENGGKWLRDTQGTNTYRTQAVITDNAEHPEIICRWFDNAFALENGIGCNKGPVGKIVNKEDDGYHAIDMSTLSEEEQEQYAWSNLWPQALPKYLPEGFEFIEENPNYDEKEVVEQTYEADLTENVIPSFWVDMDKVDEYSDISTAILDYFEQQQAMFVTGELDVEDDAAWQAYVDGIKALGLENWLSMQGIENIAE